MIDNFNIICGFSDTLQFFKKPFLERKDPGMFKLAKLADLLGTQVSENFHNAIFDVHVLQQLVQFTKKKKNCYTIILHLINIKFKKQKTKKLILHKNTWSN